MKENEFAVFKGIDGDNLPDLGVMIQACANKGLSGNVAAAYLTDMLVNDENPYSLCLESGRDVGSLRQAVVHDMEIIGKLMKEGTSLPAFAGDFVPPDLKQRAYDPSMAKKVSNLAFRLMSAESAGEMEKSLSSFYRENGVGKYALYRAFRLSGEGPDMSVVPIIGSIDVKLSDLVGYELQKKKLTDNTEAFVAGKGANNCLLYGEAGTGKSTCIKAVANEYYEKKLRVIEIYRHQFRELSECMDRIRNRGYCFIIFMDDLSFEENETEYKYLKAVIEGGLEKRPGNVLIYATSNRRHLIREKYADRMEGTDLHAEDTVEEMLSLSGRFGVTILFESPDKDDYHDIVLSLAERCGIDTDRDELLSGADKWEIRHGGRSGRAAEQYIEYLRGME
ncbi:MAG: ATP-binding protein [Lachnospiraceae bacterium]|nr:ATP-binding protein [Lachnospiraceae bacterium]